MHEVYWKNGWLVVENVIGENSVGTGTVYFPDGEPTLSVAANFGRTGDAFPTKEKMLEYFGTHSPNYPPAQPGLAE